MAQSLWTEPKKLILWSGDSTFQPVFWEKLMSDFKVQESVCNAVTVQWTNRFLSNVPGHRTSVLHISYNRT